MSTGEQVLPTGPADSPAVADGPAGRISDRALNGLCQIGVGLAIWAGYLLITHAVAIGRSSADGRGRALLDLERRLHLDIELASNRWLAHQPVLGWLCEPIRATSNGPSAGIDRRPPPEGGACPFERARAGASLTLRDYS